MIRIIKHKRICSKLTVTVTWLASWVTFKMITLKLSTYVETVLISYFYHDLINNYVVSISNVTIYNICIWL
jgi:hypothetical protein